MDDVWLVFNIKYSSNGYVVLKS